MTEEKEILIQSLITDDVNEMPTIVQAAIAIGVARQMISYYKKVSGMPYRYCAEGKKRISPELLIFSYHKSLDPVKGSKPKELNEVKKTRISSIPGVIKGSKDEFYDILGRIGDWISNPIQMPVKGIIRNCFVIGGIPGKLALVKYVIDGLEFYSDVKLDDINDNILPVVSDLIKLRRMCDNG